ncbi:hypothetical protein EZS27_004836 [termite gut metagenome]|uniref:Uncharacterized protein n=1 Tax=termite gut metagenome TaxID=433724 RepID=A0A5J4SPF7_9ZZZZ
MKIFTYYTGNAFVNNALMTIEALMKAHSVEEVTTTKLIELFHEPIKSFSLLEINLLLKNYTMIFGKNSLLYNYDNKIKKEAYNKLMLNIFNGYECDGDNICAISGLRFNKTFEAFMEEMLNKIDPSGAKKKDLAINRGWFPLIGGLGSDAQALPQAQFTYNIHPICIAILQFLPLSSLVYKKGLLLVDSSNYSFARSYVAENANRIKERIEIFTYAQHEIENVKDLTKGNYLLKAIDLIAKMEDLYSNYFDLNLWSYSNSGTGANCEIDRIPNEFLRKLVELRQKSLIGKEVERILCDKNKKFSDSFIEAFQNRDDWWGLYPTSTYKGVSPEFFEAYYEEIGLGYKIQYAKYIAYLISKYQTKSFGKYLKKSDAYKNKSYHIDLYSVLLKATEEGLWDWKHQIKILDAPNQLPLILSYKALHKAIHFFYQTYKDEDFPIKQIENIDETKIQYNVTELCNWLVSLISNEKRLVKDFQTLPHISYSPVSFHSLFLRNAEKESVNTDVIFSSFYTNEGKYIGVGIKKLLRIYFSQSNEEKKEDKEVNWEKKEIPNDFKSWFKIIDNFAYDYIIYRLHRLTENTEFVVDTKTYDRLRRDIFDIPNDNRFMIWMEDVINKLNNYQEKNKRKKWNEEDLLYNPLGERSVSFASFLIRLSFRKLFYKQIIKK